MSTGSSAGFDAGFGPPAPIPSWLGGLLAATVGLEAAQIARYLPPTDGSGRRSAVLVLFGDGGQGPSVLLLERASTMRKHAGQVAFPGGASDPEDADTTTTALREAAEEVGLDPASVQVFAVLPELFLNVTGFVVTPVLGYWLEPHPVSALDAAEVAHVVDVPISELSDPGNRFTVRHPSGYAGPGFSVRGLFVWGFTAMILDALLRLGGWELPWDVSAVRDIPDSARPTDPSAFAGTVEP